MDALLLTPYQFSDEMLKLQIYMSLLCETQIQNQKAEPEN